MLKITKRNTSRDHFYTIKTVPIMMSFISILALFASLMGIFNQNLYSEVLLTNVITDSLVFGSIIQDIISIPVSVGLLIFSILFIRKPSKKMLIPMLGLTAYLLYGYGLYAIQGQYTSIYMIYLLILGLSLYSFIFGIIELVNNINTVHLPNSFRYSFCIFIAIILLVLFPGWVSRMIPDIASRVPGEVYGVFILDLAIVFPAMAIVAYKVMRRDNKGYLLAGIVMVKVFTLCLSVALGEWLKPLYGFPQDLTMIVIFSILTIISGILSVVYFTRIKYINIEPS